jgi:dihydropyrimidinase
LLVLPGLIDPHVHFNLPFMGTVTRHDFFSGSIAAAAGGVTTIVDFAFQEKGKPVLDAVRARQAEAEGQASIDYSFHAVFTDVNHETPRQLADLIEAGICSWKVFMAYRRLGIMVDDGGLYALLEASSRLPCVGIAHAENAAIIELLVDKFLAEGNVGARYHALSRPPLAESEAVGRAARLAGATGTPFYFFHLSSSNAIAELSTAKASGWPVYAETCPHYLLLDQSIYDEPEGYHWCMSPPLRDQAHRDVLWEALANGVIDIVSSDDGAFDTESKARGRASFDTIPNGVPGVETRLSLLYSEGVQRGRITAERLVALCSTNPARLLGMYPRKGVIAPGSDADLVLFDPNAKRTLSLANSHMRAGWHPFAGWQVRGAPVATIAQGQVIMQDNKFCGRAGTGRFIHRRFDPALRWHATL